MSGRGHHVKRKKGARHHFDKRKNEERSRQQTVNKENELLENSQKHSAESCSCRCTISTSTSLLPLQWRKLDANRYCKINDSGGSIEVAATLQFSSAEWVVHVNGNKVQATCDVFESLDFTDEKSAINFMMAIDNAHQCIGNPEEVFVTVCREKDECSRAREGGSCTQPQASNAVTEIDTSTVVDSKGNTYCCTVRRSDCSILCASSSRTYRCKQCQAFRPTLRVMALRHSQKNNSRTSASSHTRYCDLTSVEKDDRLRSLHSALRASNKKVKRMEARVNQLIANKGIELEFEDADDISRLTAEVNPTVQTKFLEDSPQRIFWEQHMKYNQLKDKRQMRWHPLVIRFALNLRYLSGTAYKAVRQFGISLPSERTLYEYTHWTTAHSGVQYEFVEKFLTQIQEDTGDHHHSALCMYEMKLKSGLVFKSRTGVLSGFVDLGSCNRDIEQVMAGDEDDHDEDDKSSLLAKQV